jgi:hypothetical protein
MEKSKNMILPSAIHHRQNPLELTGTGALWVSSYSDHPVVMGGGSVLYPALQLCAWQHKSTGLITAEMNTMTTL